MFTRPRSSPPGVLVVVPNPDLDEAAALAAVIAACAIEVDAGDTGVILDRGDAFFVGDIVGLHITTLGVFVCVCVPFLLLRQIKSNQIKPGLFQEWNGTRRKTVED